MKKIVTNYEHVVILPNIRSVYNVGSIFRTSDAVGISRIYLVGVTPTPIDRFGRKRKDFAKVALGAEETVPWEHKDTLDELVTELKQQNYYIVALEQSLSSVDYKNISLPKNKKAFAFMVGEETKGLLQEEITLADVVAEISMHGKKESLNVAVAFGVAVFGILDQ